MPLSDVQPDDSTVLVLNQLEKMGEAQVRLLMSSGGLPTQHNATIIKWLAEKDQESRRRNEASQTEQSQTARSAKKAAWIAAIAAITAAVVAIIAAAIAYLSWIFPRH
jgi:hypothetical protein